MVNIWITLISLKNFNYRLLTIRVYEYFFFSFNLKLFFKHYLNSNLSSFIIKTKFDEESFMLNFVDINPLR